METLQEVSRDYSTVLWKDVRWYEIINEINLDDHRCTSCKGKMENCSWSHDTPDSVSFKWFHASHLKRLLRSNIQSPFLHTLSLQREFDLHFVLSLEIEAHIHLIFLPLV